MFSHFLAEALRWKSSGFHRTSKKMCVCQVESRQKYRLFPVTWTFVNTTVVTHIRWKTVEISHSSQFFRSDYNIVRRRHKKHAPCMVFTLSQNLIILHCSILSAGAWNPYFGAALQHVQRTACTFVKKREAGIHLAALCTLKIRREYHTPFSIQTSEITTDRGTADANLSFPLPE